MGDLESLLEKIHSVTDEKKQKNMQDKLLEGKLTLNDVVEQVKSMNSLGGFSKLKGMIPGMGNAKISDDLLGAQEEKVKKWEQERIQEKDGLRQNKIDELIAAKKAKDEADESEGKKEEE